MSPDLIISMCGSILIILKNRQSAIVNRYLLFLQINMVCRWEEKIDFSLQIELQNIR